MENTEQSQDGDTAPMPAVKAAPTPVAGQGVHYVGDDGAPMSASILAVFADGSVELQVLDPARPAGSFRASPVFSDGAQSIGTWHLPE